MTSRRNCFDDCWEARVLCMVRRGLRFRSTWFWCSHVVCRMCDPFCPLRVSCCQQACVQASALRYWSIRCSMSVSMVSQRSRVAPQNLRAKCLRRNVVTLDISCLASPQSQLDGCFREKFRRVSTCSAGNGSSCPVQVEFLYLRLWCPLPLARIVARPVSADSVVREAVSWFDVARDHDHEPLPVPLRRYRAILALKVV